MGRVAAILICATLLGGCVSGDRRPDRAALTQQVMNAERAFAQTMARRDFAAFQSFLAADTVFFNGDQAIRGSAGVAAEWKAFFDKPAAPFSWEPKVVEVLDSGTLALSSGPVRDPQGQVFATFTSIWRLEDGAWKIVFDKGNRTCE